MDLPNVSPVGQASALTMLQTAPTPAQTGREATADAKAITNDPTPEVSLPIPASPTQTGLVRKASLSDSDETPKFGTTGTSEAQRTLKPYGVIMLPEKLDATHHEALPKTSSE